MSRSLKIARDSAFLLRAKAEKFLKEAMDSRKEVDALRFFVNGREREFLGLLDEAIDNYTKAIRLQPNDPLYRERRVQLVLNDSINQLGIAREDLTFLTRIGRPELKAYYFNDLAYVMAKMNDFFGAVNAQSQALALVEQEEKELYQDKLNAYKAREIWEPGSERNNKVILRIRSQSMAQGCNLKIKIKIADKTFGVIDNNRIELLGLKPGTYPYDISGYIKCQKSSTK